jgi:hypothetical protein
VNIIIFDISQAKSPSLDPDSTWPETRPLTSAHRRSVACMHRIVFESELRHRRHTNPRLAVPLQLFSETISQLRPIVAQTVRARPRCTCRSGDAAAVPFVHLLPSTTPTLLKRTLPPPLMPLVAAHQVMHSTALIRRRLPRPATFPVGPTSLSLHSMRVVRMPEKSLWSSIWAITPRSAIYLD